MIIPMEKEHSKEVAELHLKYTKSLLSDLGRRMCVTFYEIALSSDNNFGFVYIENSKVLGFIIGTKDNSQLFKSLRIRIEICLALLSRPYLIKKLFSNLTNKFPPAPEGLYSAVDVSARRKGIGMKLYMELNEAFRERGITYFESRIDADNLPALILRRMLGAKVIEEFMEYGRRRLKLYTRFDA